jgi:hypothetical protein
MNDNTCLKQPAMQALIIVRQWQSDMCDSFTESALLSYFDYWHAHKVANRNKFAGPMNEIAKRHGIEPTQDTSLLQYHTEVEIEKGLMGSAKRTKITKALNALEKKGIISITRNPNPQYKFDQTKFFMFHPQNAQKLIDRWIENQEKTAETIDTLDSLKTANREVENSRPSVENSRPSVENVKSLQRLTTEITSEINSPPPTPSNGWGGDEPIDFDPDFSEARSHRERSQSLTVQSAKPAMIAPRLNQPEWLNGYNAEKPESWAIAHWTPNRERLLHNFAKQDLGGDSERAEGLLRLAIAMLRVEPDYYCRPNRSGYELQTKTLDFLLVPKRNSGIRPVLELAEKAQTMGIDPDAIAQSGLSDDEIQEAKAKHESRDQDAEWAEYERRQQERELASRLELERATQMQMQQRGYWRDTA